MTSQAAENVAQSDDTSSDVYGIPSSSPYMPLTKLKKRSYSKADLMSYGGEAEKPVKN